MDSTNTQPNPKVYARTIKTERQHRVRENLALLREYLRLVTMPYINADADQDWLKRCITIDKHGSAHLHFEHHYDVDTGKSTNHLKCTTSDLKLNIGNLSDLLEHIKMDLNHFGAAPKTQNFHHDTHEIWQWSTKLPLHASGLKMHLKTVIASFDAIDSRIGRKPPEGLHDTYTYRRNGSATGIAFS